MKKDGTLCSSVADMERLNLFCHLQSFNDFLPHTKSATPARFLIPCCEDWKEKMLCVSRQISRTFHNTIINAWRIFKMSPGAMLKNTQMDVAALLD